MRGFARVRRCGAFGGSLGVLVLFFAVCFSSALADDASVHRAARLSFLQGDVTVASMDNTGGNAAQINMPLAEGARITTGEDGQAEVEFEDGSVARLTPNSSVGLSVLSVDSAGNFHTQMAVLHGLVYAELRAVAKFSYSLDAGGELISPLANLTVRINLDQPPAKIAVLDGAAHVEHASTPEADGYRTDVRAGETLTGDQSDSSRYFLAQGIEQDSWDDWNLGRDQAAAEAAASRTAARDGFVGDQGYGWSDLDANGSWYDVPGQGQVWQPTVAQDESFDPYGFGSWVSYPGAGYVWASGYGWGWTPFRCGNWAYWSGFGWGWSPVAGCGLAGWGFGGVVYVVNIVQPPINYRLPTRPVHKPIGMPPVLVGQAVLARDSSVRNLQSSRLIAGVSVQPLRPMANGLTSKAGNLSGAALRSDFAVDRTSGQPVSGVTAAGYRSDSLPTALKPVSPAVSIEGAEPSGKPIGVTQRPVYPSSVQSGRSVPRTSTPSYTPRPAPPPVSHPAPPALPAVPKK
jgi:FecR protein